eukprot:scaffold67192_cov32-Tisochrysis_lutea.AAC.3
MEETLSTSTCYSRRMFGVWIKEGEWSHSDEYWEGLTDSDLRQAASEPFVQWTMGVWDADAEPSSLSKRA